MPYNGKQTMQRISKGVKQLECYVLNSIFLKCLLKDLGAGKSAQCEKVLVTKHGDLSLILSPLSGKEETPAGWPVVFKGMYAHKRNSERMKTMQ